MPIRCDWSENDDIYIEYHDKEWGVPIFDDRKLFEFLLLESAQAGLSWITILKKRQGYRMAFEGFDPYVIAAYDEKKIEELMRNEEIVKNRRKINAFIKNSQIYVETFQKENSFSEFMWNFVKGSPILHSFDDVSSIPLYIKEAEDMSMALKNLGFSFVGPVICYSLMQAVGMVNDHITSCFRYGELTCASI